MSKFYKFVKNEAKESELILEGVIASESWLEDEVSPKMFREELAQHPGALTVRINSPGGDVFAGVSMYNMLNEHEGEVTVKVDGMAGSIASLIAMAGDKIIMLPGSQMMVHQPWTVAVGNVDDLQATAEMLRKTCESIVPIYAARTGLSEERIVELLKGDGKSDGTYMTGAEAVELGFADEALVAKSSSNPVSISDMLSNIQSAVMQPVMSLKSRKAEADNATDKPQEPVEETTEAVDATDVEAGKTVDTEVNKEDTEVTDTVSDKVTQSEEKETEMTEQEKVAAAQVIEPSAQAKVTEAPKMSMKEYLKSKDAMVAFARILESNAAAGSAEDLAGTGASEVVRAEWKKHLEVKMGVTNPEIFLPTPLITEIEDAFKEGGEIWSRVSKTGMPSFNAAWDANDDPDEEKGRAKGYNREDEEEKAEQELTFANRILRPQFVYKYITLNREDVKEQRDTGALVRFVLSELPRRIIREVERAIVIGDGRAAGSDYKIQEGNPRGFYSVKADAAAGVASASVYTPVAGHTVYETLRRARALIKAEGDIILVAKEGYLLDMEFEQNANGGFLFAPGTDMARYLGVSAIVEPDWMDNDENDAYMFVPSKYRVVGDQSIEAFQNFLLKTNKNEYLQEIWAGGGLTARKSGVAVAPVSS